MPTPADLRNLGRDFELLLAKLEEAGVKVQVIPVISVRKKADISLLKIDPLIKCYTCHRLSPAAACLWCTPAEDADPGGHG